MPKNKQYVSKSQRNFFEAKKAVAHMAANQSARDHKIARLVERQSSEVIECHQRDMDHQIFALAKESYLTTDLVAHLKTLFNSEYVTQLYIPNNGSCGCADEGVSAHNSFLVLKGRKKYAVLNTPEYLGIIKNFETLKLKISTTDDLGVFLPKQEYLDVLQGMKDTGRMQKLFWHMGCGAAGLDVKRIIRENLKKNSPHDIIAAAHQMLFDSGNYEKCLHFILRRIMKNVKQEQVDKHAENLYMALSEHFEVPFECFQHMKRPHSIHPGKGLAIFFDEGNYIIEPQSVNFPLLYTLSSNITTLEKIPKRMDTLLSIVFEAHGAWGLGMVSEKNKFLVALILHPSMEHKRQEIYSLIENGIQQKHKKYIQIELFVPYSGKAAEFDAALQRQWST